MNRRRNGRPVKARVRAEAGGSLARLVTVSMLLCGLTAPARGADPLIVLSIASGGGTTVCDTNCTTCTVGSGECVATSQTDLLLCTPTSSSGGTITGCHWNVFMQGASPQLQINNQLRAVDVARNGNITFVSLNDTTVPGIGALKSTDIAVFNPIDVFQPFVGGGPYTDGTLKLYLNGDLTQSGQPAKPWDAFALLADGTCEKAISATTTTPHTCNLIGSLTGGSGGMGLGGVHFNNEDLLRCRPTGWALNGAIEACAYAMFLDASNLNAALNGMGNGITSDIEAIDFLKFTPSTMSGQMVFKMAGGNPPGFPPHDAGKDLLLYDGTFGAGNCLMGGQPCADSSDCPTVGDTCNTGSCTTGGALCATDPDCSGSGNTCNTTRFPAGTVTKFFDGVAVGLTGSGQDIEGLAIVQDSDGDGIPDGIDNCPTVPNPPSLCSGGVATCSVTHQSSECPMGQTCVQADSDGDGVGDACDQCNGRPDSVCTCGDGILDFPSEECDLGSQNGQPGSPCSSMCKISGKCTRSMLPCTLGSDCAQFASGEGCCGNNVRDDVDGPMGPVVPDEDCDDGNTINNDLCDNTCKANPAGTALIGCDDLTGPNIVAAALKVTKFKDTADQPDIDRWKTKGEAIFATGLTIDPDTENVQIIYNNTPSGTLFESTLAPGNCTPSPCFVQAGKPTKPKWKFKNKEANVPGSPSWHKGKFSIKSNLVKFTLDGRDATLFTAAQLGTTARQTIRVGDVCITAVVTCQAKGKAYKCTVIP